MYELNNSQLHVLHLTPLLQQRVNILQLGTEELASYLSEIAVENPIFDFDKVSFNSNTGYRYILSESTDQHQTSYSGNGSDAIADIQDTIQDHRLSEDLFLHLRIQVSSDLSGKERDAVLFLLGYINKSGYFDTDFKSICRESKFSVGELNLALQKIQSMDPPGVGAFSLCECLLLQLSATQNIERELIRDHLEEIPRANLKKLSKLLHCSEADIAAAISNIKLLTPKPGLDFATEAPAVYVYPDFSIQNNGAGSFEVSLLRSIAPTLVSNKRYLNLYKKTSDPQLREYLEKNIEQFEFIKKSVEQRETTLLRLVQCIVQYQDRFFRYGTLSVFRMKDAAQILGVHPSTVTRAISGKYLTCKFGTFPLRYFFVKSLSGDNAQISALDVKSEIHKLISSEPYHRPYSDSNIASLLESRGIFVSRRSVARYRCALRIPNASVRVRMI